MKMEKYATTYYFPWVKKGLGNRIAEEDKLTTSEIQKDLWLTKHRAALFLEAHFLNTDTASQDGDEEKSTIIKTKEIQFVGPSDITQVLDQAISKVTPKPLSTSMPPQYLPYIEFWEPDFPWRFSPVKPNADNRIRPWLALLVCEKNLCAEKKSGDLNYVSFSISGEEVYKSIFPSQEDSWKTAHAQGFSKETPVFSRLLALRAGGDLKPFTEYVVFLVPAFETGRLAGLGFDTEKVKDTTAQAHAWESSFEEQKTMHPRPFDFPVYHSWSFVTGQDSFDKMAEDLRVWTEAKTFIDVDITKMGEGVSFDTLGEDERPERRSIQMPAAVSSLNRKDEQCFPAPDGTFREGTVYRRLKNLLSGSPVLIENKDILSGENEREEIGGVDDDPWVVPPLYGAKHIFATSVDERDNQKSGTSWFSQLNLDIHYRAVAGLGKKIVRKFQEEFVDRAWKQVEDIQALNVELYRRLASANVTTSLQNKVSVVMENGEKHPDYMSTMLQYFRGMPQTQEILRDRNIPRAYARASFQSMTEALARIQSSVDPKSIMQNIAEAQIFRLADYKIPELPSVHQFRSHTNSIFAILSKEIFDQYLTGYFDYQRLKIDEWHFQSTIPAETRTNPVRNDQDFENGLRIATVPKDNQEYLWHYLNYEATRTHCGEKQDLCMEIIRKFLDGEFSRHGILGVTRAYKNKYSVGSNPFHGTVLSNIVAVDDQLYAEAFGSEKGLTRIGGEDGWYFLSRRLLKNGQAIEVQYREHVTSFFRGPLEEVALTPSELIGRLKRKIDGIVPSSGAGSVAASIATLTGQWKQMMEKWKNFLGFGPNSNSLSQGYDILRERIYDYFKNTPIGFTLHLDKYDKKDMQCFDSIQDYIVFLRDCNDNGTNDYLRAWKQLDECVKVIETRKDALNVAEIKERKNTERLKEEQTRQMQSNYNGFKDNLILERVREVVSEYMSEFFAETLSGRKLRESYVNELLRSKFPVMAYPIFPEPTYHYLRLLSDKFILPCVDALPDNSVVLMRTNESFVEAFLCGMNTEMGKELLWREYPTDQRGSYFRKFWDSETSREDIRNDNFFDVRPLHTWTGKIGENHASTKAGLLLFVVKGRLMKQYPMTKVYLHKASADKFKPGVITFAESADEADRSIIRPVSEAFLRDDIYVVGFKANFDQLLGNPAKGDYGYLLTFEEDVQDLSFEKNPTDSEQFIRAKDAAIAGMILKNDATLYGKHLSLFIPNPS
ncbi:hypothetical protein HQ45_07615 [Porphyromonas crevioricanis]|nr:hypothetical protein HQ45_07615 [Porphyromonas crevioricanis]